MRNVNWNLSVCVLALVFAASAASAASFTVTNLADSGAGSLRQAVADANGTAGADTIVFSGASASGTITLISGPLTLTDSVTITGPGANLLTVSGNNASRVFQIINPGATAAISGLNIADGNAGGGGGGGGIYNTGALTLTACVVVNNIDFGGNGGGGLLSVPGSSLTVANSLLTGNQSLFGAAIEYLSAVQAVLTNVTISGNTCTESATGPVEAANGGQLRLESCTVTANTSGNGNSGGVSAFSGGVVQYRNTIVSANTVQQFVANGGFLTSLGHNISSDGTGNLFAPGDLPGTDPLLGPLADNGGPTQTWALLPGSPAIDAGDPVTFPATDQRGEDRPAAATGCPAIALPDIGAFEVQPPDCNADGIPDACDIASAHLYWANDTLNSIQRAVAQPANVNVETLVPTGTATLRGIAVDTVHGKVYWSDPIARTIRRSNLDGSNVQTIVSSPNGQGVDITLDIAGGLMYWAGSSSNVIRRSDLDGNNIVTLVPGLSNPSGVALDLAGGKIYWTNQTSPNGTIQRADLNGGNVQTLIPSGLSNPAAIALDIPGGKMYWAEFGGNKIRRANLDGTNIQDVASAGLTDPAGVALDLTDGKVYWCDATTGKIQRANLDGTSPEDVVTGLTGIYRIAFVPASADVNHNGVPDECEVHRGDLNCDGVVNFDDINPFVLALVSQAAYEATYPNCLWLNGDINRDGVVNFDDINPFVACLVAGTCP